MATWTNEDRRYIEKLAELDKNMAKVYTSMAECMLFNTQHFAAVKKDMGKLQKEYERVYLNTWKKMRNLAEQLERQKK